MTPQEFQALLNGKSPQEAMQIRQWISAVGGKPFIPAQDLGPAQIAAYDTQKSQANVGYQTQLAQNAYQRQGAVAGFRNDQYDLNKQFKQQREAIPYAYNARGLARSGLRNRGLAENADTQLQTMNRFLQQQQQTLGQYDVQAQGYGQQNAASQATIEAQKQAAREQLAMQIRQMQ